MLRPIIVIAVLVLCSTAGSAQLSRPAPDLRLKTIEGRSFDLSRYKGKVVVLNFWATWCPPCRAEIPDLVQRQREYRARGLQVIGVTYPPTHRRKVQSFIRALKVNYPVVLGYKRTKALFTEVETLPFSVVIDREGKVRENIEGILLSEEFDEKIRPLLERPQ